MTQDNDEELAATVRRLRARVDDLEDQLRVGPEADAYEDPKPFVDLEQFVTEFLTKVIARRVGGELRWCNRWYLHTEAVFRLEGLWRAFETCRRADPDMGLSNWTRDYLDPCLAVLFSQTGPFAACQTDRHEHEAPLPLIPPPVGAFADGPKRADPRKVP